MKTNLHDAKLIGLAYEADKRIRLTFLTVSTARLDLILIGVRRFAATNLSDGNIVLDVMSTKFGNLEPEHVAKRVKEAFPDEFDVDPPARAHDARQQWEQWLQEVKIGKLHVLVVEPSYGAEIVAICADIGLEEASP